MTSRQLQKSIEIRTTQSFSNYRQFLWQTVIFKNVFLQKQSVVVVVVVVCLFVCFVKVSDLAHKIIFNNYQTKSTLLLLPICSYGQINYCVFVVCLLCFHTLCLFVLLVCVCVCVCVLSLIHI